MISKISRVGVVAVAVALLVAGCSSGGSSSSSSTKDSAVLGFGAEPANLDFTTTDGAAIPQLLLDNVYQGLVRLDDSGKIVPELAKSWDVSSDGKSYTFDLEKGVTFSDGEKFDADAVKFSIDRVKSTAWTVSLKTYMDIVDSVDVISPTKVKVNLSSPSNDWLFRMTTRIGAMFAPKGVSALKTKPVGTGPYVVSEFNRGDSVVLTTRKNYWDTEPKLKTVTFKYFKDANAENSALQSGSINAIVALASLDTLSQFSNKSKYTILKGGTNAEMTLSMNNASGIFTNLKVRQAVEYAIDRKSLVKSAVAGYGTLIGSMVPPTDPWYEDLSDAYPYNPAKAKKLLADAGATGATIRFRIPNLANVTAAAQIVQSDLTAVGLNVKIDTLDFPAEWLAQVFTGHDFDMSLINHVEARDIATYANPKYYWGYDNAEFQDLVKNADAGTAAEQVTDMKKAAKLLSDDAVSDWLYLEQSINVKDAKLEGLPKNQLGDSLNVTDLSWSK
jgi:peptide/nickel transport system substrate-binding protein